LLLHPFIVQQIPYCHKEHSPANNDVYSQVPSILLQMNTNNLASMPAPIHPAIMPAQSVIVHTAPGNYSVMSQYANTAITQYRVLHLISHNGSRSNSRISVSLQVNWQSSGTLT